MHKGRSENNQNQHVHGSCLVDSKFERLLQVENEGQLYVEPITVAASGQSVLIAGWPSYLHRWTASGSIERLSTDDILGAVVPSDGSARTVPSPIRSRLVGSVSALAHPNGGWDIVFAELIPYPEGVFPPPDTISRLWHGIYDGSTWHSLTEVPIPEGITLDAIGSSGLVRVADTLYWAVRTSPGIERNVVVFERTSAGWNSDVVRTRYAGHVALAHTTNVGLILTVPRWHDTTGLDFRSLSLYARGDSGWSVQRRIGIDTQLPHAPVMVNSGGRLVLAWQGEDRQVLRAVDDPMASPPPDVAIIDSGYASRWAVPLLPTASAPLWVIDHAEPGQGSRQLRFLRGSAREVREIARERSPFLDLFRAASVGNSDILLTGAILKDSTPVSFVIWKRVECTSSGRL